MEPHRKPLNMSWHFSQGQISTQMSLSLPTFVISTFLMELNEAIQQQLDQHFPRPSHVTLTLSLHVKPNQEDAEPSKQSQPR